MNDSISQLKGSDLEGVKAAYTTRRVKLENNITLLNGEIVPKPGDVALAKVKKISHHTRLELNNGRRARLFKGEKILLFYGYRYAPDQFEAVVPESLGLSHMAAAGGIITRVLSQHGKMKKPTILQPLGILGDHRGRTLNLSDFALKNIQTNRPRPLTIAVMGTAMNSGKTTTAAYLIKGLENSGLKVGAAKITGTGAGVRPTEMKDKRQHTGELYKDREKMRALMKGALAAAKNKGANIDNAVTAGYCFGGAAVLELARSGADLKGFATFHGGLKTPEGQNYSQFRGKILIMHGSADTAITMDQFAGLAKELESAGIAHEMITYGGAQHAFTVFGGSRYQEAADKKSWKRFTEYLADTLKN